MGAISQQQELKQELKLTPQIIQSTKMLQMTSLELEQYLNDIIENNPVVEAEEVEYSKEYEELCRKVSWLNIGARRSEVSEFAMYDNEPGEIDKHLEGIELHLKTQLDKRKIPNKLYALVEYYIEILDERGYLYPEAVDSICNMGVPEQMAEEALSIVQSLEPAGVGARDLRECLLLQLKRCGEENTTAYRIVHDFLSKLASNRLSQISEKLGCTVAEVREAKARISELNPDPIQDFANQELVQYIVPDAFIAEVDGQLRIFLNDFYRPRVSLSSYYSELYKNTDDVETKEYLRQKLQSAKWVIRSLEQRESTLLRCLKAVLDRQRPFFQGTSMDLQPLRMAEVAQMLDVHISTVSRAVKGKYVQCNNGTYPFKYFFNSQLGGGASSQAIKQRIAVLVSNEAPDSTLSDCEICELMALEGITVSRRTVTKYRMQLKIPSSHKRKQTAKSSH